MLSVPLVPASVCRLSVAALACLSEPNGLNPECTQLNRVSRPLCIVVDPRPPVAQFSQPLPATMPTRGCIALTNIAIGRTSYLQNSPPFR